MTERYPLVRDTGKTRQMAAGDTLTLLGALNQTRGSIAAAANLDLTAYDYFNVTGGAVTITSFSSIERGSRRVLEFSSGGNILQNNTILILPGTTDITTAAGDSAEFVFEGAGTWRCLWYQRAAGTPLVGGLDSTKLPLAGGSMTGPINYATAVSVVAGAAAAGILDLAPAASNFVAATGTGTVNFLNNAVATAGVTRTVRFDSVMTLVHSASRIVLPGAANVVTAAGDQAVFHYLGPSPDAWECISYQRADGTALVASAAVDSTKLPLDGSGQMTGPLKLKAQVTLTADATVDLGAATANSVYLSGSATVTSFGTSAAAGTRYLVQFAAGIVLTASSTMVLPGSANITTQSGDIAEFEYAGSGAWRCQYYTRKDGTSLVGAADSTKLPLAGGTMTGALNLAAEVTLASAATVAIGAAAANTVNITGTTAITAFDNIAAGARRVVVFGGALTLTHDATKLILPYAANITTVAGDTAEFESLGSGNWKCLWYTRSTTAAVKAALGLDQVNNTADTAKPVSTLQQAALDLKAPLASPALTGTPTAPTPAAGTNTTQLQTTAGALTQMQTFGLGISALPISVSDLNTTMVSQMLRGGGSLANKPANTSAVVGVHLPYSTTYNGQIMMGLTGTDAGKLFYRTLLGGTQGAWNTVAPVDSPSFTTSLASAGPIKCGQYTLSTLPSASAYSGYEIDVTDATGGAKRCRSNGTSWLILNTTTVVS